MSTVDAILMLLDEGPATNGEVAVSLGISPRLAGAHLCNLRRQRRVIALPVRIIGNGRPGRLWALSGACA